MPKTPSKQRKGVKTKRTASKTPYNKDARPSRPIIKDEKHILTQICKSLDKDVLKRLAESKGIDVSSVDNTLLCDKLIDVGFVISDLDVVNCAKLDADHIKFFLETRYGMVKDDFEQKSRDDLCVMLQQKNKEIENIKKVIKDDLTIKLFENNHLTQCVQFCEISTVDKRKISTRLENVRQRNPAAEKRFDDFHIDEIRSKLQLVSLKLLVFINDSCFKKIPSNYYQHVKTGKISLVEEDGNNVEKEFSMLVDFNSQFTQQLGNIRNAEAKFCDLLVLYGGNDSDINDSVKVQIDQIETLLNKCMDWNTNMITLWCDTGVKKWANMRRAREYGYKLKLGGDERWFVAKIAATSAAKRIHMYSWLIRPVAGLGYMHLSEPVPAGMMMSDYQNTALWHKAWQGLTGMFATATPEKTVFEKIMDVANFYFREFCYKLSPFLIDYIAKMFGYTDNNKSVGVLILMAVLATGYFGVFEISNIVTGIAATGLPYVTQKFNELTRKYLTPPAEELRILSLTVEKLEILSFCRDNFSREQLVEIIKSAGIEFDGYAADENIISKNVLCSHIAESDRGRMYITKHACEMLSYETIVRIADKLGAFENEDLKNISQRIQRRNLIDKEHFCNEMSKTGKGQNLLIRHYDKVPEYPPSSSSTSNV